MQKYLMQRVWVVCGFNGSDYPVIALKGCRVQEFGGGQLFLKRIILMFNLFLCNDNYSAKSVSVLMSSTFCVNPDSHFL